MTNIDEILSVELISTLLVAGFALSCVWCVVWWLDRALGNGHVWLVGCALCVGVSLNKLSTWRGVAVRMFDQARLIMTSVVRFVLAMLIALVHGFSILWLVLHVEICSFAGRSVLNINTEKQLQNSSDVRDRLDLRSDIVSATTADRVEKEMNGEPSSEVFYPAQTSIMKPGSRVLCQVCGFWVKPEGHELRCRMQQDPQMVYVRRRLAWLGDALHKLDVYRALMMKGADAGLAVIRVGHYIHQDAQACYMREYWSCDVKAQGGHSIAQEFEARYLDPEFRTKYLQDVFGVHFDGGLQQHYQIYMGLITVVQQKGCSDENRIQLCYIGGQLYTYELRGILLERNLENHGLEAQFSSLTASSVLAKYVREHGLGLVKARGNSDSSLAKAFKANWYGEYRAAYLRRVLNVDTATAVGKSK